MPAEGLNPHETANAASKIKRPADTEAQDIDFDELPTYVGYQVRRTQAKIFVEFEATLEGFDFTPGSFGVLTLIRANPGITQVALAAAFGIDKSTMSPVMVRLEKRGLIRREVLASDRRYHALYFERSAEASFLAAREKVRAFEGGWLRASPRPSSASWRGCWQAAATVGHRPGSETGPQRVPACTPRAGRRQSRLGGRGGAGACGAWRETARLRDARRQGAERRTAARHAGRAVRAELRQ